MTRKRYKRYITCIVVCMMCFLFVIPQASAFVLYGYKLKDGASAFKFYIDSSAMEYKDSITNGYQYWNGKSSKVSISRTTTKSASRCDSYWDDHHFGPGYDNNFAGTEHLLNNRQTNPRENNWFWCKGYYNPKLYKYENLGGYSYTVRKGVAAHEFGHVLGLAHTSTKSSLMCQYGDGRTVQTPQQDDIDGVRYLYGR